MSQTCIKAMTGSHSKSSVVIELTVNCSNEAHEEKYVCDDDSPESFEFLASPSHDWL